MKSLKENNGEGPALRQFSAANGNLRFLKKVPPALSIIFDCTFDYGDDLHLYARSVSDIYQAPSVAWTLPKGPVPPIASVDGGRTALRAFKLPRAAFSTSVLLHILLAIALGFAVTHPREALEEGALIVSITTLGNAEFDEQVAGAADQVTSTKQAEPDQDKPKERLSAATERQILADVPLNPLGPLLPPVLASPVSATEKMAVSGSPAESVTPSRQPEHPVTPTKQIKQIDRKNREQPTARKNSRKGNNGAGSRDSKRGDASGKAITGKTLPSSRGTSNRPEVGNSASSNYLGLVQKRLNRAKNRISVSGKGQVLVSFQIETNGDATSAKIIKSSGNARLDKMALAIVVKAAPFPEIPSGSGKQSWKVTVPIEFR